MGFRVVRTKTAAAVRKVKTADSVKFDFVHVPHGRVECNETEGAFTEERGFVNVKSFYMSRYEVTQALYATVLFGDSKVNSNPSGCVITDGQFPAVDGESETHRPVENITWYDAVYFCNAYSKYDRLEPVYTMSNIVRDSARHIIKAVVKADFSRNGYRLPTEIEWEYAARGGNQSSDTWNDVYSGSNAVYDVAWYKENAGYAIGAGHIGYGTHHVGKRFSNALELFDMSGNAAEMCWDKYASKLDASVGGDGPAEGSRNVIRGGSWSDAPFACAVTARGSVSPSDRFLNYGFRVVRNDLEDNWEGEDLQDDQMSAGDGFVRIPAASVKCTDTKGAFSEARGTVRIEEYYISKYPVTIDLYRDIMSHCADCNPSPSYCARSSDFDKLLRDEEPNMRPVESVSWFDAVFFCNEYSRQMGLEPVYTITDIVRDEAFRSIRSANVTADFNKNGYRLPTRIEWEYAARGADADNEAWKFKYAGSDSLDEVGWYWRNIHGGFGKRVIAAGTRGYGTHHVGRKKANSIGLYDMSGNVQQWCWDWYSENIDADTPLLGAESGLYRVACGGAWNLEEDACQVTSDGSDFPYDTDDNRGIRLVRSGDRAAVETRNVIVGAFADIQGGTFIMGDDSKYGVAANKPHSVTVDSFSIGITPVTQREWASIMDSNPSHYQNAAEGEDADLLPVESISWIDAVRYCNMLSIHRGLRPCYAVNGQTDPAYWGDTTNVEWDQSADGYRLPTEAEWEYAARGGIIGTAKSPSLYSGIGELDDVSWYESNSEGRTHQVELKSRNEMGLTDMSGNVWEWCWDWYGAEYYKDNQVNPTGPKSGKMRVNRGGAFDSYGANGTIGYRSSDYPTRKFRNVGLRLARNTGSIAIMGN
ncbi:MAG: SUMF1/EgtB/PvdO family nonheme iron enzyme [Spirochaetales bacterium]|nr:SUMF1/EgtB/PvdO family nonheme iron enzyme [Spirochaetales bacterium]